MNAQVKALVEEIVVAIQSLESPANHGETTADVCERLRHVVALVGTEKES